MLEFFCEDRIQCVTGKTKGRHGQGARWGGVVDGKEGGGPGGDSAAVIKQFRQAQARERGLAATADEFAADAMAWIISGFVQRHGDACLPQANAQGQSGEAATDDGDGLGAIHGALIFSAMNR